MLISSKYISKKLAIFTHVAERRGFPVIRFPNIPDSYFAPEHEPYRPARYYGGNYPRIHVLQLDISMPSAFGFILPPVRNFSFDACTRLTAAKSLPKPTVSAYPLELLPINQM